MRTDAIRVGGTTIKIETGWTDNLRLVFDAEGNTIGSIRCGMERWSAVGGLRPTYRAELMDKYHSAKLGRVGDAIAWILQSFKSLHDCDAAFLPSEASNG